MARRLRQFRQHVKAFEVQIVMVFFPLLTYYIYSRGMFWTRGGKVCQHVAVSTIEYVTHGGIDIGLRFRHHHCRAALANKCPKYALQAFVGTYYKHMVAQGVAS